MKKGIFPAVLGLALVSMGATAQIENFSKTISESGISINESKSEKSNLPVNSDNLKEVKNKITSNRTFTSFSGTDSGIPPKIYGMYHVKRGTHKRTNI